MHGNEEDSCQGQPQQEFLINELLAPSKQPSTSSHMLPQLLGREVPSADELDNDVGTERDDGILSPNTVLISRTHQPH